MKKILLIFACTFIAYSTTYGQDDDCIRPIVLHKLSLSVSKHGDSNSKYFKLFYVGDKFCFNSSRNTTLIGFYFQRPNYILDGIKKEYQKKIYKIAVDGLIIDGKKESLWETMYESKVIKQETYRENIRHGIYKIYNFNGKVLFEEIFQNGTGVYKDFYVTEERTLRVEGYLENNEKEGCWFYYSEDGKNERIERYDNGKLHGDYLVFNEVGDTIYHSTFVNGTGKYKEFDFKTGKVTLEGQYKDGLKVGIWHEYEEVEQPYSDETKRMEWTFNYDEINKRPQYQKSIYSIFSDGKEYHIYAEVVDSESIENAK